MIESAQIESLSRSRTSELHNDYASNKKSNCLSTPSLFSESSLVVESNRLLSSGSDTNSPRVIITSLNTNHRVLSNKMTKFRINCKSSNYNSKDIANNLYDIDDHLNKDLIYDYFFNDNYMIDNVNNNNVTSSNYTSFKENSYSNNSNNVNSINQPWALHRADTNANSSNNTNSVAANYQQTNTSNTTNSNNNTSSSSSTNNNTTSNYNNKNNTNDSNNTNKVLVFWENSSLKLLQFNDWNDGFNEWYPMPPYPPLKTYINSINKRRGAKQRTEIEFDEQLGLYLPTFKIIQKQLQQQQQQQQQQQEQLQQLQQKSINSFQHANTYSSQNHPSTRLIKELHKLVTSHNTTLIKFDDNNIPLSSQPSSTALNTTTNTNNLLNKKELQLQQQFIYVNSIVNDQRQQQQLKQQPVNQRQNSANMKRSLQVRAAFPSLVNNLIQQGNFSNMNHIENNVSSANTLLATQLLQLRSDEIDRLTSTQSAKNNNGSQNNIQHSHTSLSASSLVKQNTLPNSQIIHHSASTNSVNKTTPFIMNDDMNLIQVKKITQQQSDSSPSQDNISKYLMLNSAVRKNETDNTRNSGKQATQQIISVSCCNTNTNGLNNQNVNGNTTIGSPNAKVFKGAQPNATTISSSSSTTSSAGSMSSPSQAVTNNLSAYTNDPRYRFKHEDESQPVSIDHSKSKTAQNKIFINRTAAASNSSSSFNATTLKQNTNDTIINPFFINNPSLMPEPTSLLINSSDLIVAQHQQQQLEKQLHLATTTSSLPPIISGKRINLPLGPHRYL